MQIKNVTLSATTETEITIEQGYPYVWFKNLGDNTVYVSASPDILDNGSVKTEGVSTITSGECTSVTTKSDKVYAYALGATIVEVHAQGNPESSFKIKAKGGESSVTVEPILITHNGEYTAPEGKAYSPVNVQTPVYNITPLTLTHNHQGAEAGLYGGYSPVEVDIEMDTLNAPSNGVYEIDTTTQDGWDTVLVDVYEKYHELYTGGNNMSPQRCYFNNDVNTNNYDEFWLGGQYTYTDSNKNISIWNGRYPTSVLSSIYTNNGFIGSVGGHNTMWWRPDSTGKFMTNVYYGSDYPYAFFGVKNRDRTEECLWTNTGSTTPSTVTLSESIFDYDEICLYFVKGDGASQTSWYLTDELSVGDVVQGYDNTQYPITLNRYTIASDTTLTVLSESGGYVLMGVYGVNDTSLSETTLYTNPDPTTAPATVTLSDSYANYDELVLIGHVPSEDTVCSYYYPVKILGRWTHDAYRDRIGVFSCQRSFWLTFTSDTTLVAEANPTIILDKIIGIKRPVLSTAHELIDVVPLTANTNGTYTAPTGTAYSPVVVDVQEQPWSPLQDGYSNFWFELTDDTLSPWLNFSAKNADAVIDWGDGSGEVALDTLTPTHTYSKAGKYVVKVKGVTGLNRWLMSNFTSYSKTLTAIECNSEILSFASYSFRYAGALQNVKINNECSAIGQYSFAWTTIENINIPSSISTIDVNAFANNVILRGLLLDECTITAIPNSLCNTCAALKKVTVPSTVTSIGNTAFYSCNSLSEIHIQATTPPTLGTNNFQGLPSNYIIYVPVGTGDTYKSAAGWSAYSDHILEEGETPNRQMLSNFAKEEKGGEASPTDEDMR